MKKIDNKTLDKLLNPDFKVLLDKVEASNKEIDKHVLCSLFNIVKKAVAQNIFSPSIYIKDYNNNAVFNNTIQITAFKDIQKPLILEPKFKIDFIFDNNVDGIMHCFLKEPPFYDNNNNSLIAFKIDETIFELSKKEYMKNIQEVLSQYFPNVMISDAFADSRQVTFHHYEPKLKKWEIVNQYIF